MQVGDFLFHDIVNRKNDCRSSADGLPGPDQPARSPTLLKRFCSPYIVRFVQKLMKTALAVLLPVLVCAADPPRFVHPVPAPAALKISRDVPYRTGGAELRMDVYRPARGSQRLPVLICLNGFGVSWARSSPQAQGWAKAATAHQFVAILEDTEAGRVEENFDSLLSYLEKHAVELHIDAGRIAVIAWSGNVSAGLPLVQNAKREAIKAAAFYYGSAEVSRFRLDLPVLLVRAGLDQPATNRSFDETVRTGMVANAPWTVLNYPAGHHGFDVSDDNPLSREIIAMTFAFLKSALSTYSQQSLREGMAEAAAAGALGREDYPEAAALYGTIARAHPQDFRILLAYGNALLGARRYREARTQFDRVRVIGGAGARDLGLPGARACALDNDPAAALEWLRTIPSRFLPASVRDDPAFAALRGRAEFEKLFERP